MKSAVVTGASGFIGMRLCTYLVENGYFVYALGLDDANARLIKQHRNINYIVCDLGSELIKIEQLSTGIDYLFHLAWSGVSTDSKFDLDMQVNNFKISANIVKLINEHKIEKLVCLGSASEYAYLGKPISGMEYPAPSDYYSIVKSSVRIFLQYHAMKDGFKFNYVLIPSVYGPGRNDNNLITYSIKSLLNNEVPKYTRLEQVWNYIYIDDLIRGLVLIAEKGQNIKAYPIGGGVEKSLAEYVKIIHELIDPSIKPEIGALPYKTQQIDHCIMDCSSLIEDTGFEARMSFEEGISRTIAYFKTCE